MASAHPGKQKSLAQFRSLHLLLHPFDRPADVYDRHSTDSSISAGSDLLPSCKSGFVVADDAVYERVRQKFDAAPLTFGSH